MPTAKGWKRAFDEPIVLPGGRKLVTLKDAGTYVTKLPKAEHDAPESQAAAEALPLGRRARREISPLCAAVAPLQRFATFGAARWRCSRSAASQFWTATA
jgi:hypothetical protein